MRDVRDDGSPMPLTQYGIGANSTIMLRISVSGLLATSCACLSRLLGARSVRGQPNIARCAVCMHTCMHAVR